jgi:hypothetical protein
MGRDFSSMSFIFIMDMQRGRVASEQGERVDAEPVDPSVTGDADPLSKPARSGDA